MIFVYADEARNLLHLIYVGAVDRAAAEQMLGSAKEALVRLRPGFDILSDIRDLKAIDKNAVKIIDELMELLTECGAGTVVRVLRSPTENFGLAIMSAFHYGHDVRFVTCLSLEEAAAALSATGGDVAAPQGDDPQ